MSNLKLHEMNGIRGFCIKMKCDVLEFKYFLNDKKKAAP
ncbi:MAG: hypothetical protein HGGPFJEG_02397 [Ignavibacteria bacterium]|nr:hypothetical protein [Ignavibacteria bacterium]